MGEQFRRTYEMSFGIASTTVKFGSSSDPVNEIRVSFNVNKNDSNASNKANVTLWNLTNQSIGILEKKNCTLQLKAGYGDSMATVLKGHVTNVLTSLDNGDIKTEVEVSDGGVALKNTRLKISIKGKVGAKKIYNTIAKKLGIPVIFAKGLKFKSFPKGFSFSGKSKSALDKMAKSCKHKWSIQNGILHVTTKTKAISREAFELSASTGLIDVPKKITLTSTTKKGKSQSGWEIKFLLNGAIGVNDTVYLNSGAAKGNFKVKSLTCSGDNLGGEWVCTAQVVKI